MKRIKQFTSLDEDSLSQVNGGDGLTRAAYLFGRQIRQIKKGFLK
ncbi:MAG: ComC/BlpC family leader-containing pheromone/bacteriocin [Methanosphaera stadtmanae]|nr:ComC/BlpC family leader-containing pheromone/bacteriocin [Streptococcus equinus]MBE6489204.1 ComC/BlpC family leader-containing pheromone/bacteriocin [Methanosphaera stadtmanae]GEB10655.1 hypothetical protein SEQ01_08460 [Streptococcus equinus]SEL07263.1 COMC family protein [Streptococcus equinus]